ncbi:MAG: hypothetical protein IPH13_10465 [Planctomycetes bacterium]|nr:hypothetical protein [Planctomycetota bacterium]MCC7173450.1 hypothetical protein [Planctomycetota bacterium]
MPAKRSRKTGSILVLALIVSATASIAGMHLMIVSDLRLRRSYALARIQDAVRVSSSGLQYARSRLGISAGYQGGSVVDPEFPQATFVLDVEPAGVLKAHATSTGTFGDATFATNADLIAPPHPALGFNVFSASTIHLHDTTLKGYLRANGNVTGEGVVDFFGALMTTSGSSVTAQIAPGQIEFVPESMAAPTLPFSAYQSLAATLIDPPIVQGKVCIKGVAFRPNHNPYGSTNARGAYVFDAGHRSVELLDVYVDGTLTILNAGSVTIGQGCHFVAFDPALATLLVEGDLEVQLQDDLRESSLAVDLNGDGDLVDVFAPRLEGVVGTSGSLEIVGTGTLKGCFIAESVTIEGYPTIESASSFKSQPVEGFVVPGPWNVLAGTIQQGTGP